MHEQRRACKRHIRNSHILLVMTPDEQIGKRIATFRKERHLNQAEFLNLLRTRGIDWNQATLSRIERGSRSMKLTEAFIVSDTLSIEPRDLLPETANLGYRIESLKLRLNDLNLIAQQAIKRRNQTRNGLGALLLARSLLAGNDDYTVDSSALEFMFLLATYGEPTYNANWTGMDRLPDAAAILGIEPVELSSDFEDGFTAAFEKTVRAAINRVYPRLKFTGRDSDIFRVKGLTEMLDSPHPLPPMGTDGLWAFLQSKNQDAAPDHESAPDDMFGP